MLDIRKIMGELRGINMEDCILVLSPEEIEVCLREINKRIKRILYVYEQSLKDERYNYKSYVYAVMLYISSFNNLFKYSLANIIVNLNSLMINDLDKKQIKKIVLECKHEIEEIQNKMG